MLLSVRLGFGLFGNKFLIIQKKTWIEEFLPSAREGAVRMRNVGKRVGLSAVRGDMH